MHTACQVWDVTAKLTTLPGKVLHDSTSVQTKHSPNHSKHTSGVTSRVGLPGVDTRARPCLQTEAYMSVCVCVAEADRMKVWGLGGEGRGGGVDNLQEAELGSIAGLL